MGGRKHGDDTVHPFVNDAAVVIQAGLGEFHHEASLAGAIGYGGESGIQKAS